MGRAMAVGFELVGLLALAGCLPKIGPPDVFTTTGTVQFIDLEGSFYGIVADDGSRYDPLNLPPEFQEGGLHVRFTARILKDPATTHMWGTPVEILKIEKLNDS